MEKPLRSLGFLFLCHLPVCQSVHVAHVCYALTSLFLKLLQLAKHLGEWSIRKVQRKPAYKHAATTPAARLIPRPAVEVAELFPEESDAE